MENEIISLTAQIVSAHVSANDVSTGQLPGLIREVHQALITAGPAPAEPAKADPTVGAKKFVFADRILCLDCGKSFKMLKRHILAEHQMTSDEYRAKWGLPMSYPLVATDYAAARSQLAKDSGFGQKVAAPWSPTKKKPGRPKRG
jgi:predicted transcriptional regulator